MSILKMAQLTDPDSEEYLELISNIYKQFENLSKTMKLYALTESHFYIQLARRCFDEEVAKDFDRHQR